MNKARSTHRQLWRLYSTKKKYESLYTRISSEINDGSFYELPEMIRKGMLRRLRLLYHRLLSLFKRINIAAAALTTAFLMLTGTALAPAFTVQTGINNPLNGVSAGSLSIPTFGDVDGDGDKDAFIGNFNGDVIFYTDIATPLPVELSTFTAVTENNDVLLNWKTATEVNNYGFEVQRTAISQQLTAETWQKIGFIPGSGTSNSPKEYSFTDKDAQPGTYKYRLKQIDNDGKFEYSEEVEVNVNAVAASYSLQQNYPNPFNPTTVIKYTLPSEDRVTLKLYDVLGREVATLINADQPAGNHTYTLSSEKLHLSSGVYIYKIQSGSFTDVKKMILLK